MAKILASNKSKHSWRAYSTAPNWIPGMCMGRTFQGNTIQKMRVATGTESSDSQNFPRIYEVGHGQTMKNITLSTGSVLPFGV
jgi:hypothetical protein